MEGSTHFVVCCSTSVHFSAAVSADDCSSPADWLVMPGVVPSADEDLLRAVRVFLTPVDNEYSVGYSPFVPAGQFS